MTNSFYFVFFYLLVRVAIDIYRVESSVKLNLNASSLAAFIVLSYLTVLVYLGYNSVALLLVKKYPVSFVNVFTFIAFLVGYELSHPLFRYISGIKVSKRRKASGRKLAFNILLHYFYNSVVAILFLLLAAFVLMVI